MRVGCLGFLLLLLCLPVVLTAQQQRNMLTSQFSKENIAQSFDDAAAQQLYPAYENRTAWENINPAYRQQLIKEGEEAMGYTWQVVPASVYLKYVSTGDRYVMEDLFNQNLAAIKKLAFAELAEGKKRFIPQLIDGIWTVCEVTSWSLSASLNLQKKGSGLPDRSEPIIELGAGITANLVAWVYHFFNKEFDKTSPLVSERIRLEIGRRILEPYYTRNDFWWMALDGKTRLVNNWNVWLNYNVLTCLLLVETDKQKKIEALYKSMRSVDQFINYYKNDGACEEGPAYWSHAGGMLYNYLDLLKKSTGGSVNIFDSSLIKNIGSYICKAYISSNWFLNYADAEAQYKADAGLIYAFGKAVQNTAMTGFGAYLAREQGWEKMVPVGTAFAGLRNLFAANEVLATTPSQPFLKDAWLSETGIAIARDKEGTDKGFYFSALAGHNDESHNHNDVGTCVLFYNGQPLLIDVGSGTYISKTFSKERYDIWTMRSAYHNVPLINGTEQKEGRQYAAQNPLFSSSAKEAVFSVNIAGAYPAEAAVKRWQRSYRLLRGQSFTISDEYELTAFKKATELHFMTSALVRKQKDGWLQMTIDGQTMDWQYNPQQLDVTIEPVAITDKRLLQSWPASISRIIFTIKNKKLADKGQLVIKQSKLD